MMRDTPYFRYDRPTLQSRAGALAGIAKQCGAQLLFSIKACPWSPIVQEISSFVDGFSCSSTYEILHANASLNCARKPVHVTSPGLSADALASLREGDRVSFNSVEQVSRFAGRGHEQRQGLRINPGISPRLDPRYDPCRRASKLGVPLLDTPNLPTAVVRSIRGLHVHANCEAHDARWLEISAKRLAKYTPDSLEIDWVNLGGGYLFDDSSDITPVVSAVQLLRDRFGDIDVILEPGAAFVSHAATLVSRVIDIFSADGEQVAVLDASVNHVPEVLEFGLKLSVADGESADNALHHSRGASYILAGCSCLPGDEFGEYTFRRPLAVGSVVEFTCAGAYTIAKAHWLNGIQLPSLYLMDGDEVASHRHFGYSDYGAMYGMVGVNVDGK